MLPSESAEPAPPNLSLRALFVRFLRFGLLAFGGPIAQIGMLRQELVDRERWTTSERFLRALAVYQALPGPEAHEMCCWFGYLARGRLGAIAAGLGFMLPGFLLMLGCAYLYTTYGMRSALAASAMVGMQAIAVALVVRAVPRIAAHSLRPRFAFVAALAGLIAGLGNLPFALPLLFGALWLPAIRRGRTAALALGIGIAIAFAVAALWIWPYAAATNATTIPAESVLRPTFWPMLGLGLQAGLLTFGGAYTAIPFVRDAAVTDHGWLQPAQFLDGLAIGSVLPAPLVIFGTFTGYVAGGLPCALAMTLGIFAPAFAFTLIGHAAIERAIDHRRLHAVLDGIAAAVTGLIAATAWQLLHPLVQSLGSAAIASAALVITFAWRSPWATPVLMTCGAIAGLLLR